MALTCAPGCRRRAVLLTAMAAAAWFAVAEASAASAATVLVRAGGNLQEALNGARAGDVIALEAGAMFVGNFVLPARPDRGDPVTIRTSATDARLPGYATRVSPDVSYLLPKLRSPNSEPALRTAAGTRGWRLVLLEFLGSADGSGEILRLGDATSAQSSLASVPSDIWIDRCYVHADPGAPQKRGIALNSGVTTIKNSWISEIKVSGQDSQAIAGWNGPGPYAILNNRLEAAGECFLLGGGDPAIRDLVPSDVLFAGNYVTRPPAWRNSSWQVKNLFELKNARRVRVQGNLFENNWQAAQSGYAILFTPRNQDGGAPWATVEDVRFSYNVVRHVSGGVSILGHDNPNRSGTCRGVEVSNNLFYDVDGSRWGGSGEFLLIGDGPADIVVEHNTILQSGNILSAYGGTADRPTPIPGFAFCWNIARHNEYGVHGSDHGVGTDTLNAYFPSFVFSKNVIGGGSSSAYPPDNTFVSVSGFDHLFADTAGGDFRVTGNGQARGGTDTTPGADIDQVNSAWRAAQAGEWTDSPRFQRDRDRPQPPRRPKGGDRQ